VINHEFKAKFKTLLIIAVSQHLKVMKTKLTKK